MDGRRQWTRIVAGMAVAVALAAPALADLDVVFVIDTTGSMSGELREVKERVRQIAEAIRVGRRDVLRFGVVAYRDRGDAYVTTSAPLTTDVHETEGFLASLAADGGGDGPEDVLAGLEAAIQGMGWGGGERRIVLIGDAPPHLDYGDDPTPEDLVRAAREARIVIDAIGCRSLPESGIRFFRRMAYATEGSYQHIGAVRSPEAGLAEAVTRAVKSEGGGPLSGFDREIRVTPAGRGEGDGRFRVDVRREGPGGQGGPPRCLLEVSLPEGASLADSPVVEAGEDGLLVRLELAPGDGGSERFSLESCPGPEAPVHVQMGGAS